MNITRKDIAIKIHEIMGPFLQEKGFKYNGKYKQFRCPIPEGYLIFAYRIEYANTTIFRLDYQFEVAFLDTIPIYCETKDISKENYGYQASVYKLSYQLGLAPQNQQYIEYTTEEELVAIFDHLKSNWKIVDEYYLSHDSIKKVASKYGTENFFLNGEKNNEFDRLFGNFIYYIIISCFNGNSNINELLEIFKRGLATNEYCINILHKLVQILQVKFPNLNIKTI